MVVSKDIMTRLYERHCFKILAKVYKGLADAISSQERLRIYNNPSYVKGVREGS